MDLGLNLRRKQHVAVLSDGLSDLYPHDMSMYELPPMSDISLAEFEDIAIDRLKVLRILEFATNKGFRPLSADWKGFVYEELQKGNLKKFLRLVKSKGTTNPNDLDYQARRVDHISHFILRLAYCRSDPLRKWFLTRELDLFKLRFIELSQRAVSDFLNINKLHYQPISEQEKLQYRDELTESTAGLFVFDTTAFYKVRFTEVLELVKKRRIFIREGFAYVPNFELVSCVSSIFRAKLNESLAFYCKRLPYLDDERIYNLLTNLHSVYTGEDYSEDKAVADINISHLNHYSKIHYPLCMQHIHSVFKAAHHLKHGSRLQYLLFLKGIGLSMEDCLQFWKDEFTKLIDGDKFDKLYAYSVKHAYGKVGRMQSYSPYSCIKIISNNIGPGDHHGCPFKNWDTAILSQKLEELGIGTKGVTEITQFAEKGHYQLACGKFYEHSHGQENKNVINHPNQYFLDSFNNSKEAEGASSTSKS